MQGCRAVGCTASLLKFKTCHGRTINNGAVREVGVCNSNPLGQVTQRMIPQLEGRLCSLALCHKKQTISQIHSIRTQTARLKSQTVVVLSQKWLFELQEFCRKP